MSVYRGCEGKVFISESEGDPLVFVGELNSWSINESFSANEFRQIGAYYPNRGTSARDWSFNFSGFFDPMDTGQSILKTGAIRFCSVYPSGDDIAQKPALSGLIYIDSIDSSGAPDDLISLSINGTGTGELTGLNSFIGE